MRRTPLKRKTRLLARKPGLRRTAHSTKPPSSADQARFEILRRIGCTACYINRMTGLASAQLAHRNLEIHHLLSGGRRIGHEATVCLCHYHHQGKRLPFVEYGYREQALVFGPSLEREPRRFREVYGADQELLNFQNKLLADQIRRDQKEGVPA
jgi:hypothetical protein